MNKRCLLGRLACGAFTAALAITVLGLPSPAPAQAQGFPERAVRIIVPTAPGGSIDTTARVVAGKLAELLGKPVVIENRAGAAMIIGAEAAAKAAPDGYTFLVAHDGTMAMNPVVYPNLGYHSQRDFEPVADLWAREPLAPRDVRRIALAERLVRLRFCGRSAYQVRTMAAASHSKTRALRQLRQGTRCALRGAESKKQVLCSDTQ